MNETPQLAWTTITPDLARIWMGRNHRNRYVRHTWVKYLAKQMQEGRFERVTDAIGFSENGLLINGQHRLLACIEANRSFEAIVVSGLTERAFQVIDRGIGRTLADVLKMPTTLIADAGICWRLSKNFHGGRIAEEDIADTAAWWSNAYNELMQGISLSRGLRGAGVRVGFGARWAIQATAAGRSYVNSQFHALMASDTLRMSQAIAVLWKRVLQEKYGSHGHEGRITAAAMCFYCADPQRADVVPIIRDMRRPLEELRGIMSNMEAAWVAAETGGHPYQFAKELRQTAIAPRRSERKAVEEADHHRMSV